MVCTVTMRESTTHCASRERARLGVLLEAHPWNRDCIVCARNGLEHHVLAWNEPGKPRGTAILAHGFADAAATWDDVARDVAERTGLRVLVPDHRGFGDGARVPEGGYYDFPDYVADLVAVADAMDAGRFFLAGHSLGATVATYVAGAFPDRVAKVALVDGVGPMDNPPDVAPLKMRRWIETVQGAKRPTFASVDEAVRRLARFNPDLDEAILRRRAAQLLRQVDGGFAWKHDPLHGTTSPLPFYVATYMAFARAITCPALYVSGGAKGYHVEDEDARLACIQDLKRVTIEGGHALHWSRAKELAGVMGEFFAA